jgi:hypothetical protein
MQAARDLDPGREPAREAPDGDQALEHLDAGPG